MVTKTQDEINEMKAEILAGTLDPGAIKRYREEEDLNVYGHDAKRRRDGSYIEQGVGSPGNQTRNSIEAYKKYHANDVAYEKTLARLEKELAEADARRAAERGRI